MDPNTVYRNFCEARKETRLANAGQHYRELHHWLITGGFEPNWTLEQKREFEQLGHLYLGCY